METINLEKPARINLEKNETISLTKEGNSTSEKLVKVFAGARWGTIKRTRKVVEEKSTGGFLSRLFGGGSTEKVEREEVTSEKDVDLDLSILMYDSNRNLVDKVWFRHKVSNDNSIRHSGDDLTGTRGEVVDRDNEIISIDLERVSASSKYLVVILNSFSHDKFDEVPYASLRIYSNKSGRPLDVGDVLAKYKLDQKEYKDKESIVLGYFYRDKSGWWKFKADGTTTKEQSISQIERGSALKVISRCNED